MYVQVLTFTLNDSEREAASHFCERGMLGLTEFDGYVSDMCLTRPNNGVFGGMIVWSDWKALETFRHSEFYAKLVLSTYFTDVNDHAFSVSDTSPTGHQADLLAAA